MSFLSPIAALLAASLTVPLLVLLYFLKLRRQTLDISSTLLWKKAIEDLQVNAPFQKLRRNLLLLLQLLVLAAMLTAFARPTMHGLVEQGRRVVIVIDHSASMNATDLSPTRLDRAKQQAIQLIEGVSAHGDDPAHAAEGVMVISFAHGGRVVQPFTSDRTLLRASILAIPPTDQSSHLAEALELIAPYAAGADSGDAGGRLLVYILTDGRIVEDPPLALTGAEVRFIRIGAQPAAGAPDNLAIVSFAARRDYDHPRWVQATARLANDSPEPIDVNLTLKLDNRPIRVRRVRVPPFNTRDNQPGEKIVNYRVSLQGTGLLELAHDHTDALAADDHAALVITPPRRLRVLLVTPGNVFLDRALRGVAGVETVFAMTPARYDLQTPNQLWRGPVGSMSDRGFDLIVFDRHSPSVVPPMSCLYFHAAPPIEGLRLVSPRENGSSVQTFWSWRRDHPLLRHVALDNVVFAGPARLVLPEAADILATGPAGPLIANIPHDRRNHLVTGVDLFQSNWPLELTFPVFIDNAVQWLALGEDTDTAVAYQPGDVAVVPVDPTLTRLRYTGPVTLDASVHAGQATLAMFERVGLYQADQPVHEPWNRLAVNMVNPDESDLRAVQRLPLRVDPGQSTRAVAGIQREVWPYFIWAALGLLLVEWLIYTRRMHL